MERRVREEGAASGGCWPARRVSFGDAEAWAEVHFWNVRFGSFRLKVSHEGSWGGHLNRWWLREDYEKGKH